MRVLLVNDFLEKGGAEVYASGLKSLLESDGNEVLLLTCGMSEGLSSYMLRWFNPFAFVKTLRIIDGFRPDVAHFHGISRCLSPSVLLAAKLKKTPVIMTVHDYHYVCPKTWMIYADGNPCEHGYGLKCLTSACHPKSSMLLNWLKWLKVGLHRLFLKRFVDLFICPSKTLADWMRKTMNLANVSFIPNFALTKNAGRKTEPKNQILFAGRLSKEKGVDVLLKAMAAVKKQHPKARLKIIGDGPEAENLKAQAKELGLKETAEFAGRIPNDLMQKHYSESMAVVMPSMWMENSPITLFEAFADGQPVIASDLGGFKDFIKDGVNGMLFKAGNVQELAGKLSQLLSDQASASKMGERALQEYEKNYKPEVHLRKILEAYASVRKNAA